MLGDQAIGVDADVSKVEDLQRMIDSAVKAFGRLDIMVNNAGVEDADLGPGYDGEAVRVRVERQPQERVFRDATGRQADDRAGRRRPDHQHHVRPRGLADARQHGLLPVEGWHADADPNRGRGARTP